MYVCVELERERERESKMAEILTQRRLYESSVKSVLFFLYFHETGTGPPQGIQSS